jgi:hypothetical protein
VASFEEVDVSVHKDAHHRTKLLLNVLPRSAVFVSAHRALASFKPPTTTTTTATDHGKNLSETTTTGAARGAATPADSERVSLLQPLPEQLQLAGVVDSLMSKLLERAALDCTARHHRTAASARLGGLSSALHSGDWARFPGLWETTLGKPKSFSRDVAGR